MACMLESSMLHSEVTPHPMAWYWSQGVAFVFTNWQAVVRRYPRWNEEITVKTWPTSFKGFVAERSFEVFDSNGESIAKSHSGWVYMDLNRRKPARAPLDVLNGFGDFMPPALERNFRLPERSGFAEAGSRAIEVTRRDLDANRHVNSVAYLDWAMDSLTAHGLCRAGRVVEMKTTYRKECSLGAPVEVAALRNTDGDSDAIVLIQEADGEKALLCEVYLKFGEA